MKVIAIDPGNKKSAMVIMDGETLKPLYMELMTSGRLNTYLADINEKATEQMLLLVKQMAEREGVTEQLKAQDQMLWVQRMNNIRNRAMEVVNNDLIYA